MPLDASPKPQRAVIDAGAAALLVVDCQEGFRASCQPILGKISELLLRFQDEYSTVVFIAQKAAVHGSTAPLQHLKHFAPRGGAGFLLCSELVGFVPAAPNVAAFPGEALRAMLGKSARMMDVEDSGERMLHDHPRCILVQKRTYDGFESTELHTELTRRGIRTVVMVGVLSDKCVQATAQTASRLGYSVVWARDATAAGASPQAGERHEQAVKGAAESGAVVLPSWVIGKLLQRPPPSHCGSAIADSSGDIARCRSQRPKTRKQRKKKRLRSPQLGGGRMWCEDRLWRDDTSESSSNTPRSLPSARARVSAAGYESDGGTHTSVPRRAPTRSGGAFAVEAPPTAAVGEGLGAAFVINKPGTLSLCTRPPPYLA
eukprot:Hpha_TRINITY_DN34742_c0_g1::TRINITY_DN34742_c0_g1_i1::g.178077::m.178077